MAPLDRYSVAAFGLAIFIRQDLKICVKFLEQPRIDGEIDVLWGRKRVKSNRTGPDLVGSG